MIYLSCAQIWAACHGRENRMSAPSVKGTCLVKECIELTASELKVRALTQLFSLVLSYFTHARNSLRPD